MTKLDIHASKDYDIHIGAKLLDEVGSIIAKLKKPGIAALVADDTVDALYTERTIASLEKSGFKTVKFVFTHGEQSKNAETYLKLLSFFAANSLTRTDIAVALGGGVTGDLTGFAAATYLRGIDFVQLPTTLLAAVDSSVGGKTGIDLPQGKNLVGAFRQPLAVICDTETLKTLPPDVFAAGVAETLKAAVIGDEALFCMLEKGTKDCDIEKVITRAIAVKRSLVEADEFETDVRRLLNLGHTAGHAIEKLSDYAVSHGHAVAAGIALAAKIADNIGFSDEKTAPRIINALRENFLPVDCGYSAENIAVAALSDKKRSGGEITLILPKKIGLCEQYKIPVSMLCELFGFGI